MGVTQAKLSPESRLRVGMVDPRLDETVTYAAEMDMEAGQDDVRRMRRGLCPLVIIVLPFSLCFPCLLICMYCVYNDQKKIIIAEVEKTQAYITDSTFVYISPHLPVERGRTTVPLTSIASVINHGHVLTVNIKPTAPEVIMNTSRPSGEGGYSSYATRSIQIERIKNASDFADKIRSHIKQMK